MGVHRHGGTMPGGLTPICNSCGVALCWDISAVDYLRDGRFWDAWRCEDCNGGQPFTRKAHAAAALRGERE